MHYLKLHFFFHLERHLEGIKIIVFSPEKHAEEVYVVFLS